MSKKLLKVNKPEAVKVKRKYTCGSGCSVLAKRAKWLDTRIRQFFQIVGRLELTVNAGEQDRAILLQVQTYTKILHELHDENVESIMHLMLCSTLSLRRQRACTKFTIGACVKLLPKWRVKLGAFAPPEYAELFVSGLSGSTAQCTYLHNGAQQTLMVGCVGLRLAKNARSKS